MTAKKHSSGPNRAELGLDPEALAEFDRYSDRARRAEPTGAALFSGASGTGKTLAAEVLAAELGRELIRVDLQMFVSKYIGETEKNLGTLFDKAEAAGAVLFFDEADAIFGKRTGVKDAHDRYANQEVSYLLQRVEKYPYPVLLATADRALVDPGLRRYFVCGIDFGR